MKTKKIEINGIPAILWGEETEHVIIAVHGNLSHKADVPFELLALAATKQMYQVLSFDLPEHGDRKLENTPCIVQNAVHELQFIMDYVMVFWHIITSHLHMHGFYHQYLICKKS